MKQREVVWSENFMEAKRLVAFLVFKRGWEIIQICCNENKIGFLLEREVEESELEHVGDD